MVVGFKRFSDEFIEFSDQFVLIGGAACELFFEEAEVEFRLTKDLDIIVIVENLSQAFIDRFWKFVTDGGYEYEKADGTKTLYRFKNPTQTDYPKQIELFARTDDYDFENHHRVIPIFKGNDEQAFSAILLDEDYYLFVKSAIVLLDEFPVLDKVHLIPLKAKAYINNKQRKEQGENISSKNITKHCRDVFRLHGLLNDETRCHLPASIKQDMLDFMRVVSQNREDLGPNWSTEKIDSIKESLTLIFDLGL